MATVRELPDVAATAALAAELAGLARPGDVLALSGDLGTGKTTFARAFIESLAQRFGSRREEVPSPTFTLVQTYEFPGLSVWHFDLYRLTKPEDALELGIEEAFSGAISLIEWPERLGPYLPPDRLDLEFEFVDGTTRRVRLTGQGQWRDRMDRLHG
jgi:tRNA threonylcarbamoyladenosine biosynthesis protein TsaE